MALEAEVRGDRGCDAAGFETEEALEAGSVSELQGLEQARNPCSVRDTGEGQPSDTFLLSPVGHLVSGAVRALCGNRWQPQEGIDTDVSRQSGERATVPSGSFSQRPLACAS